MAVIGPWFGLVADHGVELVTELQVVVLFVSAISVVVVIQPSLVTEPWVVVVSGDQVWVLEGIQL